ncbi:hypothetical protein HZH68_003299 [Vespula germanica]|uniref:Uncharacterized protein n=1 Tax=Vespula germanica TaxID=30212 RepID=A0A834U2P5_VESGE|nr:hypothetical protein HZH68_003299 [Vespula germanica]
MVKFTNVLRGPRRTANPVAEERPVEYPFACRARCTCDRATRSRRVDVSDRRILRGWRERMWDLELGRTLDSKPSSTIRRRDKLELHREDLRKHTACVYSAELGIASAVSLNEEREVEEEEEEEEAPNLELDGVICYLLTITLRRDRNVCRPFSTESLQQ